MNIPGRLEHWAQKLAIMVENSERAVNALFGGLAKLFDTRLRIVIVMPVEKRTL